ncbi:hypothetical protein NDU88_000561, partial [Pleurodeles waltl]
PRAPYLPPCPFSCGLMLRACGCPVPFICLPAPFGCGLVRLACVCPMPPICLPANLRL